MNMSMSPWAASGSAPRRRHSSARSHPVISSLCLARPRPRDPSPLQPIVHGPSPALNAGFALPTPPPRSLAPRRVSPDNAHLQLDVKVWMILINLKLSKRSWMQEYRPNYSLYLKSGHWLPLLGSGAEDEKRAKRGVEEPASGACV